MPDCADGARQCGVRLRSRLTVGRPVRWVSHLEFVRMLTRALRRTAVPVQYSHGYNPRPQMSFATARPVGLSSEAEFVDFTMAKQYCPRNFGEALDSCMPRDFSVCRCMAVYEDGPSLMAALNASRYELMYPGVGGQLEHWKAAMAELLAREDIFVTRTRHSKPDRRLDIRPNIYQLEVQRQQDDARVLADLGLGGERNVRPSELASVLTPLVDQVSALHDISRPIIHRLEVYRRENGQEISAWRV